MADNYDLALTLRTLTGTTAEMSKTLDADDVCTEVFWGEISIGAGSSNVDVKLGGLTDPKILVVKGAEKVVFRLDTTGADYLRCNPLAIVGDEDDGLGIDEILVDNNDTGAHVISVFAAQ